MSNATPPTPPTTNGKGPTPGGSTATPRSVLVRPEITALHHEEAVCSGLIAQGPLVFPKIKNRTHWREFLASPVTNAIARAAWECDKAGLVVNRPNIQDMLGRLKDRNGGVLWGGTVTSSDLTRLNDAGFDSIIVGLPDSAQAIRDRALAREGQRTLEQAAIALADRPHEARSILKQAMNETERLTTDLRETRRDAGTEAVMREDRKKLISFPTGITMLDVEVGGMPVASTTAVMANQKGRKTSTLEFMCLKPLLSPHGRVLYNIVIDGDRTIVRNQMLAMLAIGYMRDEYEAELSTFMDRYKMERAEAETHLDGGEKEWNLRPDRLYSATSWRSERQQKAIERAEKTFLGWGDRFQIRDIDDNVDDLDTLMDVTNESCDRFGTNIVVVDYVQAVRKSGLGNKIYDQVEEVTRELHRLGRKRRVSMVWALQRNEEANRDGDLGMSAGVLGGGAAVRHVTTLIQCIYDRWNNPDYLTLKLWAARFGGVVEHQYSINRFSGLIYNPDADWKGMNA